MPRTIEDGDVPTRDEFKALTLSIMRNGITNSFRMRERIAEERDLDVNWHTDGDWNASPSGRFINNHAFALVALQQEGKIKRIAEHEYQLLP